MKKNQRVLREILHRTYERGERVMGIRVPAQHPLTRKDIDGLEEQAKATGAKLGFLGEAANSVGGYLAGLPAGGGMPQALKKRALLL